MTTSDIDRIQRRSVGVLVGSQVAGGLGVSAAIAVGAVLVTEVFDREDLSGFVQSSLVLGAALLAMPAAALAVRSGRRAGLAAAYATGSLGAVLAVIAAQTQALPLLLVGTALLGGGTAAGLQARYAATDLAGAAHRGRALSTVVWSTTVGAVVGPNLAGPSGRLAEHWGIEPLAGPFLVGAVVMVIAALIVGFGLRPDPLLLARARADETSTAGVESGARMAAARRRQPRVLRTGWSAITASPWAFFALLAIVVAHTVMVSVMVMTPVHMTHGGASINVIGLVISIHVAGMYALSPIMGWLADRLGRPPVVLGGLAVLLTAAVLCGVSGTGHSPVLTAGLFLLGVGWSACLVAASTMLTETVDVDARPAVQGASDLLMGLAAAGGGALAGVVVGSLGYGVLNVGAGVVTVVPAVAFVILRVRVGPH